MAKTTTFLGVEASTLKPTKGHRPAVWEGMLGTVYALNDARECRYFDYDWEAAVAFAGVDAARDPRLHKVTPDRDYKWIRKGSTHSNPRRGKLVLWITKNP